MWITVLNATCCSAKCHPAECCSAGRRSNEYHSAWCYFDEYCCLFSVGHYAESYSA